MNLPDPPLALSELAVALRAHALCVAAEPHRGRFMTCPCQEHTAEARRQLAPNP